MQQTIPLQLILGFVIFLGMFAAVMIGMTVSDSMQFEEYLQLGAVFAPLILVAVLAARKFWLAAIIGLLPLSMNIPLQFLTQFPLVLDVALVIIAFVIGGYCMGKFQKPVIFNVGSALVMAAGVLVLARFIKDRPGSAFMGGSGGGAQALLTLLAFVAFWAISKTAAEADWQPMRVLQIAFGLLLVAYIHRIIFVGILGKGADEDMGGGGLMGGVMSNLYSRPSWMLGGILLAWVLYQFGPQCGPLLQNQNLFIVILGLLGTSALAGNRSRPLFAIASILVVCYLFRQHWRALFMLGAACALATILILSLGKEAMPAKMRRTISTIIPVSEEEVIALRREGIVSSEMGWESEFRAEVYNLAWKKIATNPVFGSGFTFSAQDLVTLYAIGTAKNDLALERLVMTGGFHNSVLALAVGAGIPSAVFFAVGSLLVMLRLLKLGREQTDPKMLLFVAGLAGCLPPVIGQALMNGGAQDLVRWCLLLGIANGIVMNPKFQPQAAAPAVEPSAPQPAPAVP